MRKYVLAMLAMALLPACAFAVDGQVLINQSTVMAAGGFPYRITQPGSYKLSGNLVATQQAILVAANDVVLDLNGFSVSCSFVLFNTLSTLNCIGDSGVFGAAGVSQVSVRNGSVITTATGANMESAGIRPAAVAVGFLDSGNVIVEELHMDISSASGGIYGLAFGTNSIIRHNIISGAVDEICPSLVDGNINTSGSLTIGGSGCVFVNNIGSFHL